MTLLKSTNYFCLMASMLDADDTAAALVDADVLDDLVHAIDLKFTELEIIQFEHGANALDGYETFDAVVAGSEPA